TAGGATTASGATATSGGTATTGAATGGTTAATVAPVKGGTTRGVTATSITVESISNIAPPSRQEPIPRIDAGSKARVDRANKDKELKRTINYKGVLDDTGDEGRDLDVARQAVLQDNAFGLFITSQGATGSGEFLNSEKVPYIGWGFSNSYCGDNA